MGIMKKGDKPEVVGFVDFYPEYSDVREYYKKGNTMLVWEADPWIDCTKSYAESCYIHAGISGAAHILEGSDAQALLNRVSMNDCMRWPIGKCKHLVQCTETGLVANHGLYTRDSETRFRGFACSPLEVMRELNNNKYDVELSFEDNFTFQISGPLSLTVIEKVVGQNLHDVAFLETRPITIPNIEADWLEICRIGMSGTLAYELRGPRAVSAQVYDAVYEAGRPMGMKRLGWRAYTVNHTFGGYPQMTCSFEMGRYSDPEFAKKSTGTTVILSGSVDPDNMAARFRTPIELDWGWTAKFNHDFIGREAVEAEYNNPKRKIVSLVWNKEDVVDIYASQFEEEPYKYMEMPSAVPCAAGGHADWVCDKDGKEIGIASTAVYSAYYKVFLCQAVLDIDEIEEGREVIVKWGDFGGRIKDVRAIIAKYPYNQLVENQKYDLSTVPVGCE